MGVQGFPFWVLELGSGLISRRNREMTLDTKLGGPGRLGPKQWEWDLEQTQTRTQTGTVCTRVHGCWYFLPAVESLVIIIYSSNENNDNILLQDFRALVVSRSRLI